MKSIRLEKVSKTYNGDPVFTDLSLTIPGGKFFALLGPSGSGKTTLLRVIAGFEDLDSGSIYLGNENITHMPINKRRVNTVFQNYALFPHLSVFENIAYSQRIKKVPKEIIEKRVNKIIHTFGLEPHKGKNINQLSGGQKQRVTLARAIINEPEVLLLDEPLAALDFALREKMLLELMDLQEKLGTTFIYVTHDQLEALTAADQMAIMNSNGEIEQVGTPKEIYEFPASSFVAQFVGSSNIYRGSIKDNRQKFEIPGLGLFSVYVPYPKPWMVDGVQALMSIRPEKIFISKQPSTQFSNELKGIVEGIVYHGRSTEYKILLNNDLRMSVFQQNEEHFPYEVIDYDDLVYLYFQKENVVLLER